MRIVINISNRCHLLNVGYKTVVIIVEYELSSLYKFLLEHSENEICQVLITFRAEMRWRRDFSSVLALKSLLSHVIIETRYWRPRTCQGQHSVCPTLDLGPLRICDVSSTQAPP